MRNEGLFPESLDGSMGFAEFWKGSYPAALPVAPELRLSYRPRWSRVHSFDDSRRYPVSRRERPALLARHNAVADRVLRRSACYLVMAFLASYTPKPVDFCQNTVNFQFAGNGRPGHPLYDGDLLSFWVAAVDWRRGAFDDLIWRIAHDRHPAEVLLVSTQTLNILAPYDGGADLFFGRENELREFEREFCEWLDPEAAVKRHQN